MSMFWFCTFNGVKRILCRNNVQTIEVIIIYKILLDLHWSRFIINTEAYCNLIRQTHLGFIWSGYI